MTPTAPSERATILASDIINMIDGALKAANFRIVDKTFIPKAKAVLSAKLQQAFDLEREEERQCT